MRRCYLLACFGILVCVGLIGIHCELREKENSSEQDVIVEDEEDQASPEQQSCAPSSEKPRNVVIVSTLDGTIYGLDAGRSGKVLWSLSTEEPLLSSSLSKIEVIRNGIPTQLIPALDGSIYQFNGYELEALPVTAETLLTSTARLSNDAMMVGSKDVSTYGVNVRTGKVHYVCTARGCRVSGRQIADDEGLLVIRRDTRTLRAVELRSGYERWNFSVGDLKVDYIPDGKSSAVLAIESGSASQDTLYFQDTPTVTSCPPPSSKDVVMQEDSENIELQLSVSKNMLKGVSRDDGNKYWSHNFPYAVSNVWQLEDANFKEVDLFNAKIVPELSGETQESQQGDSLVDLTPQPSMFLGNYQSQLYIQTSPRTKAQMRAAIEQIQHGHVSRRELHGEDQRRPDDHVVSMPRVNWRPYLATAPSRTPWLNTEQQRHRTKPQLTGPNTVSGSGSKGLNDAGNGGVPANTNALSVFQDDGYPYDGGYYLMTETCPITGKRGNKNPQIEELQFSVIPSIWTWWREITLVASIASALTAVLVHFVTRRLHRNTPAEVPPCTAPSNQQVEDKTADTVKADKAEKSESDKTEVVKSASNTQPLEYHSREGAKEKIMREVYALAKLDHIGIVRYYQAWMESPPAGWVEDKDKDIVYSSTCSSNAQSSEFTPTRSPQLSNRTSFPPHPCSATAFSKTHRLNTPMEHAVGGAGDRLCPDKGVNRNTAPCICDDVGSRLGSDSTSRGVNSHGDFADSSSEGPWPDEDSGASFGNFDSEDAPGLLGVQQSGLDIENALLHDSHRPVSVDKKRRLRKDTANGRTRNLPEPPTDSSTSSSVVFAHTAPTDDGQSRFVADDSVALGNSSSSSDGVSFRGATADSATRFDTSALGANDKVPSGVTKRDTLDNRLHPKASESKRADHVTTERREQTSGVVASPTVPASAAIPRPKLYLYIQMQLCRETLKEWLAANTSARDLQFIFDVFEQITSAVKYVHVKAGLIHRDLKPSNIFFSMDSMVKIGDFGLVTATAESRGDSAQLFERSDSSGYQGGSSSIGPGGRRFFGQGDSEVKGDAQGAGSSRYTDQVGTQLYMSPEQLSGSGYDSKVDIYALGLILFELLYPFTTQMERVLTLTAARELKFPDAFRAQQPEHHEYLKWLLAQKPTDRPSATQVLESSLLEEYYGSTCTPRERRRRLTSGCGQSESSSD